MEPIIISIISIISLARSVVGIVEIIAKSLTAQKKLQAQWQAADWTLASPDRTSHDVEDSAEPDQPVDLDRPRLPSLGIINWFSTSETRWRVLQGLDALLSMATWAGWRGMRVTGLTFQSRAKDVLSDGGVRDCVSQLNNQSNAINLLLTALNW